MAIQNRRGAYTDFDPTKMVPGEYAIVLSGDPNDTNGHAVYMCFGSGAVKRLALTENIGELVTFTDSSTNGNIVISIGT